MITLDVNGKNYSADVSPDTQLLWVIRDSLNLMGTKYGCGSGECGSCVVLIDGKVERSCTVTVEQVLGKKITTIEGIPEDHPVKRAWIQEQVVQCGYCSPGIIMQVISLISETPNPDSKKIIDGLDDVVCRCGTYQGIKTGVKTALKIMGKEG